MNVDRRVFLILTASLSACAGAEREPIQRLPIASAASPSSVESAPPAPVPIAALPPLIPSAASMQDAAPPDPLPDAITSYVDSVHRAHRCDERTFDPAPRAAEGMPTHYSALARQCEPFETTGYPSSCAEGAFGCALVVNSLTDDAAKRVLACLRAKKGEEICAHTTNGPAVPVAQGCAERAFVSTRPRVDTEAICRPIVDACAGRADAVTLDACERYVSSLRKCDAVGGALRCLHDRCNIAACLDSWVESDFY
jgi:hypothetical protein